MSCHEDFPWGLKNNLSSSSTSALLESTIGHESFISLHCWKQLIPFSLSKQTPPEHWFEKTTSPLCCLQMSSATVGFGSFQSLYNSVICGENQTTVEFTGAAKCITSHQRSFSRWGAAGQVEYRRVLLQPQAWYFQHGGCVLPKVRIS